MSTAPVERVAGPSFGGAAEVDRSAYPFESRWLDLAAGRMHYVDEGAGEPLLFVHGTPTWSFEWRHLIRALAPSHRCIATDHLGFGLSERPGNFPYTPEAHACNLDEFVSKLDPKPFISRAWARRLQFGMACSGTLSAAGRFKHVEGRGRFVLWYPRNRYDDPRAGTSSPRHS